MMLFYITFSEYYRGLQQPSPQTKDRSVRRLATLTRGIQATQVAVRCPRPISPRCPSPYPTASASPAHAPPAS